MGMSASNGNENFELRIGIRSLLLAVIILFCLMTLTGLLTWSMTPGNYERQVVDGKEMIISGSYAPSGQDKLPVWRWYTSTFAVLWGPDSVTLISIILFMLLVAGAIRVMQEGGILTFLITSITTRFAGRKYRMEAAIILVFMLFGSILGSMEEVVVLVPLIVALAVKMGWDTLTGLGLSLGAIAFGFAAAISNPFTIGVAQKIAGLPVFSGAWFRIIIFLIVYMLYTLYVVRISRKRETFLELKHETSQDARHSQESMPVPGKERKFHHGLVWFGCCMACMAAMIILTSWVPAIADIILPIVMVCFLVGGIGSGIITGLTGKQVLKTFSSGIAGVSPGIILVLMASAIKHILVSAGVMDSILHLAEARIADSGPYPAILILFGVVLILNLFISSGSAKAFLIMPIVSPLADLVGLSRQSAVLAFMFGDGFSNILYPTNALLLICLAITGISYGKWFRWIWKIELLMFAVSIALLLTAVAIGY